MAQRLRVPITQAIFEYPGRGVKKTLFRMCNKYDIFDPKNTPKPIGLVFTAGWGKEKSLGRGGD
jgi:hypothetical protein